MRYQKARVVKVNFADEAHLIGTVMWVQVGPPICVDIVNPEDNSVNPGEWCYVVESVDHLGIHGACIAALVELQPEFKEVDE